ncbi:MAG: hypothetical protein PHS99_05170 [Candidatus Marinimicrobia bacterium]|nr:hypothetical protein [Candidatus Neomarinimicrobiota bacterium]
MDKKKCLWLGFILFMFLSCQSNIVHLEIKISHDENSSPIDSLKFSLTDLPGIQYVALSPDTSFITLIYDRYKTHSDQIITRISNHGYHPVLVSKTFISKEEEPSS